MFFKRKKKQEPKPKTKAPIERYSELDDYDPQALIKYCQDYVSQHALQKPLPTPTGHAMDSCSAPGPLPQPVLCGVNPIIAQYFVQTDSFIGYEMMSVIAQNWLVMKGCSLKPKEAVRKWFSIGLSNGEELKPETIKKIEFYDKKYRLKKNLIEGCTFNNIFGIRHIMFKHKNPNFDYSKPFNPDAFRDGGYAGMAQIDPTWMTPEFKNDDLTDPASISYYEPTWWLINGVRVHKSHFVILNGDPVADILKPSYRYGGISMVQKVYYRVYNAEVTANEGPKLTKTKRLNWLKTDEEKASSNKGGIKQRLEKLASIRDNFGVQLLGKSDEIGQSDTNLGDFDSVTMVQYQLICSIFDAPASKILGTGHQGFSTGEADIDQYVESLEELQYNEMTPIVQAHYQRLIPSIGRSIGIEDGMGIDVHWNPIKVMSEAEISDVRLKNTQADQALYNIGAVDNFDVRERIINDANSGYEGLEMPEEDDLIDG